MLRLSEARCSLSGYFGAVFLLAVCSFAAGQGITQPTLGTTVTTQPVPTPSTTTAASSASSTPAAGITSSMLAPAASDSDSAAPLLAPGPQAPLSAEQREMRDALLELQIAAESIVISPIPWPWREDINPCSHGLPGWPYVMCSPEDDVIGLEFNLGAAISGDMIPEFGTLLGHFPSFTTLNFSYVMLNGSLPASWGASFRYLKHLEFSFVIGDPLHNFNTTLPAEWGEAGAWPQLESLNISFGLNMDVNGNPVPLNLFLGGRTQPAWSDPDGWPALKSLQLGFCFLGGPLPRGWANTFKKLETMVLSQNALTGTLPTEWGIGGAFPMLKLLDLSFASFFPGVHEDRFVQGSLEGTLPPTWGYAGGLRSLQTLNLTTNHFSGQLPDAWAGRLNLSAFDISSNPRIYGSLPSSWGSNMTLQEVDVSGNSLSGSVPASWSRIKHATLLPENAGMCGALPAGMAAEQHTATNSALSMSPLQPLTSLPNCGWETYMRAFARSLTFPGSPINSNLQGWMMDDNMTPCNWTGVECDMLGRLIGIDLSLRSIEGSLDGALQSLSDLQYLNLSMNALYGGLPSNWSFPKLRLLNLTNNRLGGSLPTGWAGVSSFPALQGLSLQGNFFRGSLPTAWAAPEAFPELWTLNLGSNSLTGSLPEEWGMNGSFASMTALGLAHNQLMTGPLPEAWGTSSGMRRLKILDASSCALTGTLPDAWADQLSGLFYVDLNHNRLTGSLPAEWSSLQLTRLSLAHNQLQSTIPGTWASNGSFSSTFWLDLSNNLLTGEIPATFGQSRDLSALSNDPDSNALASAGIHTLGCLFYTGLTLANNSFSGVLPAGLQTSVAAVALLPGNTGIWGAAPLPAGAVAAEIINTANSRWIMYTSDMLHKGAYLGYKCEVGCLVPMWVQQAVGVLCDRQQQPVPVTNWGFAPQQKARLPFLQEDLGPLLLQVAASTNIQTVLSLQNGTGWTDDGSPCCSWTGITCDELNSSVTGINLPGSNLAGRLVKEWAEIPGLQHLNLSHNSLAGELPREWAGLFGQLATLDLSFNLINGSLPREWGNNDSFPNLQTLSLSNNALRGPIAEGWGSGWRQLADLQLSHNALSSSLPAGWSAPEAFTALQSLDLSSNAGLVGSLPDFGDAGSVPALRQLNVERCQFAGQLPSSWSKLARLELLDASNNHISGTLPPEWGVHGSLPALTVMDASSNQIHGEIPSVWGSDGSMASLAVLDVAFNALAGSLPNWKAENRMPSLQALAARPANTAVCGALPAGLPVIDKTTNTSVAASSLEPCPKNGVGTGGIVGIVVGAVVAVVVAAMLAWLWRRQVAQARLEGAQSYDPLAAFMSAVDRMHTREPASKLLQSVQSDIPPSRLAILEDERGQPVKLGSGAYGQVYKAVLDSDQIVAVKFLNPAAVGTQDASRDSFEAEISIMRFCKHSNIVSCLGAYMDQNLIYCVCEYMHRGNLYLALANDQDNEFGWYEGGRGVALDCARGLQYMHSNGVLHLDLKACNVLLGEDGTAKISDVGLSRVLGNKTHLTTGVLPGGTYDFQAPECLMGKKVGFAADVFSFGVLLLEICTKERQRRGFYIFPEKVPEQCPASIVELAQNCLQGDPTLRPSAKEIMQIIEAS